VVELITQDQNNLTKGGVHAELGVAVHWPRKMQEESVLFFLHA
jgi:hypothetical protein